MTWRLLSAVLVVPLLSFAAEEAAKTAATPDVAAVAPTERAQFRVYLLMGQSNMVGRDVREMEALGKNPHVLSLTGAGIWVVAQDPLHEPFGKIPPGVGPGLSFGRAMSAADKNITIGLVPCAVGGTPLRRWVKGGDLYEAAVVRAKVAAKSGMLAGVIWHQGESDTDKQETADTYEARLTQMIKDLRSDLGVADLPVVVGQLGEFLTVEKYPGVETVRAAFKRMPSALARVGFADSTGLGDKGDKLHFSTEAQREMGARFAKAMLALEKPVPPTPAAVVDVWPEGKMPGKGTTEAEGPMSAKEDGFLRITNISRPTLTVFPAVKRGTPTPAMIVSPGGGYSYVVFDKEGTEIATWLNAHGITALVLKYRVPHNRDGALQDVQRALRVTRAHAAEWNVDPKQLGVIGFSAGGNLSAKASNRFSEPTYPEIDDTDRLSCRPDFAVLIYPAYLGKDGVVADDLNLKAAMPPTFIAQTEDDRSFVPGTKLYAAALEAAKQPCKFLLYPTGGHGYGLRATTEVKAWPEECLKWLGEIGVR